MQVEPVTVNSTQPLLVKLLDVERRSDVERIGLGLLRLTTTQMRKETAAAQDKAERHFVRLEVLIVEQNKEPHQGARSNKAAAARIDEEQELLRAAGPRRAVGR